MCYRDICYALARSLSAAGGDSSSSNDHAATVPAPINRARTQQMSVIATVAVPSTEFPLGSLLDAEHNGRLSVETTIPTNEGVIPYIWVPGEVTDGVVDDLTSKPMVAAASVVDEYDDTTLVQIEWTAGVNGILESIRESDAIVTSAVGTTDRWTFRLRFPSYESLSEFYTGSVDRGLSIELVQLHEAVGSSDDRRFGLTEPQRELIAAAYEAGYFDVPRETTLVELGDRLDISDSAVSQRLRRGLDALIGSTLVVDPQYYECAPGSECESESAAKTPEPKSTDTEMRTRTESPHAGREPGRESGTDSGSSPSSSSGPDPSIHPDE